MLGISHRNASTFIDEREIVGAIEIGLQADEGRRW